MHLNTCTVFLVFLGVFFFATIVSLSLSYINVHINGIVTKVETDHIEQFLQIFYGVILALSCNKRTPLLPPFFQSP